VLNVLGSLVSVDWLFQDFYHLVLDFDSRRGRWVQRSLLPIRCSWRAILDHVYHWLDGTATSLVIVLSTQTFPGVSLVTLLKPPFHLPCTNSTNAEEQLQRITWTLVECVSNLQYSEDPLNKGLHFTFFLAWFRCCGRVFGVDLSPIHDLPRPCCLTSDWIFELNLEFVRIPARQGSPPETPQDTPAATWIDAPLLGILLVHICCRRYCCLPVRSIRPLPLLQ